MKTTMIRPTPMEKIGRLAVILLAAALMGLLLGGCAPQLVWSNPKKTPQAAELDFSECRALALTRVPVPDSPPVVSSSSDTAADTIYQYGLRQAPINRALAAQMAVYDACMRRRGYTSTPASEFKGETCTPGQNCIR